MTDHPSNNDLKQYANGLLGIDQSEVIEEHLESCRICDEFLERLGGEEQAFIDVVRSAWQKNQSSDASWLSEHTLPPDESTATSSRQHSEIGDYEILSELGRGGMGVVYRAMDRKLKREVALKVILAGEHSSSDLRHRFRQEAEVIARLRHPGIVQIFEVGESNGLPFIALELVPGSNLAELVGSRPQPIRWAAAMVLQLANAVSYAHQQAIIHRDLKPGNVLIVEQDSGEASTSGAGSGDFQVEGVPVTKITDFGLAKQLDSDEQMTRTGHALGTPAYMSPEQASGDSSQIGAATDIYALGAILYQLLCGRPPFVGDDPVGVLLAVLETEPVSPRNERLEIPKDLETVCMKCLMKRPEDRYESARDLATDLELFLDGEPILARPPNFGRRLYRWARQHPLLALPYLGIVICYALHLFAKYVLNLPFHREGLGRYAPAILVSFGAFVTVTDWLGRRYDQREYAQLAFIGISVVMFCFALSLDQGPLSAPVPLLFLFICSSILVLPKSWMLWFVTLICTASYASLAAYAYYVSRRGVAELEQVIAFIGSLILVAICMQLLLRRISPRSGQTKHTTTATVVRSKGG